MNLARTAEQAALSWVVFGLLVAYGVVVLTFGYYWYLRYAWRPGVVVTMMVCVVAMLTMQMWHMRNLYLVSVGWRPAMPERYSLAVQLQAVTALFVACIFAGIALDIARGRAPSRFSAVMAFVGVGALSLAVATTLFDFAIQLSDPRSAGSVWSSVSWTWTVLAVVMGVVAYLVRPGERVRYPWYWYAFWMGAACAPLGMEAPAVAAEAEEWRKRRGTPGADA